jgi:hypothetical protein
LFLEFNTRAGWTGWYSPTRIWTQKSIYFVVSELCTRQSSKRVNSKLRQCRVTALFTALLLNKICLPTCARHVVSICWSFLWNSSKIQLQITKLWAAILLQGNAVTWPSRKRPKCCAQHIVSIWWSFLWNSCKIQFK